MPRKKATTLSPKQRKAILLLLGGTSDTETALRCQIARKTLYRWKKQRSFTDGMNDTAKECYRDSMALLSALSSQAVGVLRDTMADTVLATAGERIRAARIVLETATHFHAPRGDESLGAIPIAKFLGGDVMDDTDFDIGLEDSA